MNEVLIFFKAPRYGHYSYAEVEAVDEYFHWKRHNENKPNKPCKTFQQWCNKEMPTIDAIAYYSRYCECGTIFKWIGRAPRVTNVLFWLYHKVQNKVMFDYNVFPIDKMQIEQLLRDCEAAVDDPENAIKYFPVPDEGKMNMPRTEYLIPILKSILANTYFNTEQVYYRIEYVG